jgi:hypothetical protein
MMTVRQPGTWKRVLAIAPLLLVIVSLPTEVALRCRMDGQLREACCCPAEKAASPGVTPALSSRCCCDREVSTRTVPTVRTAPQMPSAPALAAILLPYPTLAIPRPGSSALVARQSSPAREGPRILLLKQAFLI